MNQSVLLVASIFSTLSWGIDGCMFKVLLHVLSSHESQPINFPEKAALLLSIQKVITST